MLFRSRLCNPYGEEDFCMTVKGAVRYQGKESIACIDTEAGEEIKVEKVS